MRMIRLIHFLKKEQYILIEVIDQTYKIYKDDKVVGKDYLQEFEKVFKGKFTMPFINSQNLEYM